MRHTKIQHFIHCDIFFVFDNTVSRTHRRNLRRTFVTRNLPQRDDCYRTSDPERERSGRGLRCRRPAWHCGERPAAWSPHRCETLRPNSRRRHAKAPLSQGRKGYSRMPQTESANRCSWNRTTDLSASAPVT